MKLPVLETPTTTLPAASRDACGGSLFDHAVRLLPERARMLVYPAGRNARLAVADMIDRDGFGMRRFVGFADDKPMVEDDECLTLENAVAKWQPTHILLCARQPDLERTLALRAKEIAPTLPVITVRDKLIQALVPDNRLPRALSDIDSVTIVMCKTCNIRCSFCYQTDFSQRMSPDIFQEKLLPVYPHVSVIKLVGGEVTAYRHALPFVQTIPDRYPNATLRLTTNGILFDDRWAQVFCRTGGSVHHSIVAATSETYHRVTGQDKHGLVVANIEATIKLRERTKSSLGVFIGMVVVPDTQHEIESLVRLGESLGVDGVEIGVDTAQMHALDEATIRRQVERVTSHGTIHVHWDRLAMLYPDMIVDETIDDPCDLPDRAIFVEVNGTVYVCCHSHVAIGSLVRDDIETIWNSPAAFAVARDVAGGHCASCPQDCIYRPATVRAPRHALRP